MSKPQRITKFYSGVSAVVAFVTQPVPALDELILVPIHYRLCKRLAKQHGVDKKDLPWPQIRKIIWYGVAARLVANFSVGFIPVVGMFANAVTAIALTEYIGHYVQNVLENPGVKPAEITMDTLKGMFTEAIRRYGEKKAAADAAKKEAPAAAPAEASGATA